LSRSNDDEVVAVSGDIADRKTAERAIVRRRDPLRAHRHAHQQRWHLHRKAFTEYTEADYEAYLGTNIAGFFHMTQLAIAEMEKQGSGHIVQISTSLVDNRDRWRTLRARVADKRRTE
jgi:NADP-dependent 3-hydroxy acid dehydrogenase YdfG